MPLRLLAVSAACALATGAAAAPPKDLQLARALVVHHGDVPSYWDATIVANPCALSGVRGTARATARWGSPTHGVWSVAVVAAASSGGGGLFKSVVQRLPGCVLEALSRAHPPGTSVSTAVEPLSYGQLGDAISGWRIVASRRFANGTTDRFPVDVVVLRIGRAVLWDILGTDFRRPGETSGKRLDLLILHNALSRAAALG